MPKLPVCSGAEAVKAFERAGWTKRPQRGTSHVTLTKAGSPVVLTVPQHKTLKPGTLRRLIRDSDLTVDEFRKFL